MRQQILDIQDTTHVINRVLINGNTRVIILHDTLQHLRECRAEIQIHDILTAGHHLLRCLIAKAHNALQHILLLLQFLLVSQFQCLFQIVHTEHVVLFLHHLLGQCARTDEDGCQRIEQFAK